MYETSKGTNPLLVFILIKMTNNKVIRDVRLCFSKKIDTMKLISLDKGVV